MKRPPCWLLCRSWCPLLNIHHRRSPPSSTLFLLHFCLMVHSQIWRPTWVDLPMLMYLFKATWVNIPVCFCRHNEECAISFVLLFSVRRHCWRPFKPKILLGIGLADLSPSPSFGPIRPFFSHYPFFHSGLILSSLDLFDAAAALRSQVCTGRGEDNGKQSEHVGVSAKVLMWGRRKTALRSNL